MRSACNWRRQRLAELGCEIPYSLRFVPVDFEAGVSWGEQLVDAGFDSGKPAIVGTTGRTMSASSRLSRSSSWPRGWVPRRSPRAAGELTERTWPVAPMACVRRALRN